MKLKKLTTFAFALTAAVALSISGCKDDKEEGEPPKQEGPKVSLYKGDAVGDLRWTFENRTLDIGTQIRFGIEVQHPKEVSKVEVIRKTISGPGSGTSVSIWDTTLNASFPSKTRIKQELVTTGVVATQVFVFTFRATDKDGNIGEVSVQVSPSVAIGERTDAKIWNQAEDGAYDLVQAVSLNTANEQGRHDLKLSPSGGGFKFISGNGSKFKSYNSVGKTTYQGFTEYARIETAWNQSGSDANESPLITNNPEQLILVKSAQNNRVYVIQIYEINSDHVVFDYKGEGL